MDVGMVPALSDCCFQSRILDMREDFTSQSRLLLRLPTLTELDQGQSDTLPPGRCILPPCLSSLSASHETNLARCRVRFVENTTILPISVHSGVTSLSNSVSKCMCATKRITGSDPQNFHSITKHVPRRLFRSQTSPSLVAHHVQRRLQRPSRCRKSRGTTGSQDQGGQRGC